MKSLLLTYDYPPTIGGIANILATFMRLAGDDRCTILAPGAPGAGAFDADHPIRTVRFPALSGCGLFGKVVSFLLASVWTCFWLVRQRPDLVMAGQVVRHLVDQQQVAGSHQVVWDGLDASGAPTANGVCIYELRAGEYRALRKMLLIK